jgi:hypothetical protein
MKSFDEGCWSEQKVKAAADECGHLVKQLEFFVEFATGAGNKNSAGGIALTVFHAFHNPGRLAAFGAIGALGCVHYFLAVRRFGDLSHGSILS